MLKQPLNAFRGQASELEIQRQEMRNTKKQMLEILAKSTNKDTQTIEKDMNRPLYFDPSEAVKYGLIDKVRLPFKYVLKNSSKSTAGAGELMDLAYTQNVHYRIPSYHLCLLLIHNLVRTRSFHFYKSVQVAINGAIISR